MTLVPTLFPTLSRIEEMQAQRWILFYDDTLSHSIFFFLCKKKKTKKEIQVKFPVDLYIAMLRKKEIPFRSFMSNHYSARP